MVNPQTGPPQEMERNSAFTWTRNKWQLEQCDINRKTCANCAVVTILSSPIYLSLAGRPGWVTLDCDRLCANSRNFSAPPLPTLLKYTNLKPRLSPPKWGWPPSPTRDMRYRPPPPTASMERKGMESQENKSKKHGSKTPNPTTIIEFRIRGQLLRAIEGGGIISRKITII